MEYIDPKMTREKALKLAIEQLKKRIQGLAIEANLHDVYKANYQGAVRASKDRKELVQAVKELEELLAEM